MDCVHHTATGERQLVSSHSAEVKSLSATIKSIIQTSNAVITTQLIDESFSQSIHQSINQSRETYLLSYLWFRAKFKETARKGSGRLEVFEFEEEGLCRLEGEDEVLGLEVAVCKVSSHFTQSLLVRESGFGKFASRYLHG